VNEPVEIIVVNLVGELVKTFEYRGNPASSFQIDLGGNPPGLYFLNILSGNISVTRKLSLIK
jgi:hypothetical protein